MARKRMLSASDALDLVPDNMPDGAALAMAAEMAGMDYADFIDELVMSHDEGEPAPAEKRHSCGICGKRFATASAKRSHKRDMRGRAGHGGQAVKP